MPMTNRNITILTILVISIFTNSFALGNFDSCEINNHNIIHLIGEKHDDLECIRFHDQLKQEAINGNIILALED